MAASNNDAGMEAVRAWYTNLLNQVVKEMVRLNAVRGGKVQASPVWMLPQEMLIAKVWSVGHESDFIWAISVDKFIADYVAGSIASTPRDVARHFSLKWQMDADRLLAGEAQKAPPASTDKKLQEHSKRLIQHAEALYDLCNQDSAWQQPDPVAD